jgi:hypothetical protein
MYMQPRYSKVPWISDSDLEEGRRCMWEIEYRRNEDLASCWQVTTYEKGSSLAYMVLHAVRGNGNDGGEITLALSDTPRFDVFAKESFVIAQSNPRRNTDSKDAEV